MSRPMLTALLLAPLLAPFSRQDVPQNRKRTDHVVEQHRIVGDNIDVPDATIVGNKVEGEHDEGGVPIVDSELDDTPGEQRGASKMEINASKMEINASRMEINASRMEINASKMEHRFFSRMRKHEEEANRSRTNVTLDAGDAREKGHSMFDGKIVDGAMNKLLKFGEEQDMLDLLIKAESQACWSVLAFELREIIDAGRKYRAAQKELEQWRKNRSS